ncbi:hypothetical protein GCM10018952_24900 [Streptosporangium vulgare]
MMPTTLSAATSTVVRIGRPRLMSRHRELARWSPAAIITRVSTGTVTEAVLRSTETTPRSTGAESTITSVVSKTRGRLRKRAIFMGVRATRTPKP